MVTVLITVYNFEHCIKECLDSIKLQSYQDWTAIILDNASVDNSASIIKEEIKGDDRFQFIQNKKNTGPYPALNQMIELVNTPYFSRVDGDDFVNPAYLSKALDLLKQHPNLNAIFTNFQFFPSNVVSDYPIDIPLKTPFKLNNVVQQGLKSSRDYFSESLNRFFKGIILCKTKAVRELGYFKTWRTEADTLMWAQLSVTGQVAVIPEGLYHYRQSPNSVTNTVHKDAEDLYWKKKLLIELASWLHTNEKRLIPNINTEITNINQEYKKHILYRLKSNGLWFKYLKTLFSPSSSLE